MSLENSQYTFHSLQDVTRAEFQKEVDRITKEVDHVEEDSSAAVPAKRARLTQEPSSRSQRCQTRPVSGTILEVILEDFLCHEHMRVELNKEINFIVGRNGSGKSAILTGIVVALGGSASTTGRGAALKDFIKHGCNSGRVTCVVSNAGALSYKKDIYGEKICVVRTLQATGGSAIKLRSERGKLISSKMEDLRAMTLQLGIQVDNPISVLDQNTARHFLSQSKPENKFELFMRATNLETLQKIYIDITLNVDRVNTEITKKQRQLLDNNAEVKEAQKRWEMFENLEKDRAKSVDLKMELLWAEVRDYMVLLGRVNKDLAKVQKEKDHLEKVLASSENTETESLLQEIESLKADVQSIEIEKKEIESNIKDAKLKYSALQQRQKKFDQEKSQKEKQIIEKEREIEDYRTEIRAQEQKMLPDHVHKRQRQREEIQELQRILQERKGIRQSKEAEAQELQRKLSAVRDSLSQLQRSRRPYEEEQRNLTTQLQGLESNDSNLSLFGPNMPELVRQIEMCKQFSTKPIGPLGSYVKVNDAKWALAVECAMKSRLNTFLVANKEDEKLLQSIMRRVCTRGPKPSVIRCGFPTTAYDTSRTAARTPEYSNVLDVVEISNVVARNMLVDFCRLESVMLIPTDNECYRLLHQAHTVPRNCSKAYTLNGDSYMPAPRYGSYGSNQRAATVLQSSRADIIRQSRQRIQELKGILENVQENIASTNSEYQNICKQLDICRAFMKKVSAEILTTQGKLEKLKDMEQPDTNSVSVLREELNTREQELQQLRSQLNEIPGKVQAVETERAELKQNGSALHANLKEVSEKMEQFQTKQKACREQLDELQSAKVGKKRKLDQVSKQEEQLIVRSRELEAKHEKAREAAEKYDTHVRSEVAGNDFRSQSNTNRSIETIDRELKSLTKRLASVEKTLGQNAEASGKDFHEKMNAYNATKRYIVALKTNAEYLKMALDQRKGLYHTQKKLMCGVVSHQFTRVLRFRNCTGNVRVNFERKSLDISVGPVDEGERAGLGTSSLSGGERSYATMAFVIALWNVTELPFYYLDEFDVFMDMLNRQTVLTLLLRFAKQKTGFQFGFLTPLDTTAISGSDRVSIFKLADPRTQ